MGENYVHFVCTRDEARALIDASGRDRFWVSNCGCREAHGRCARSRHDLCLSFEPVAASGGGGVREITRAGVEEILREAGTRRLVPRPFQDERRTRLAGFCFCCDDCCAYFQDPSLETCNRGALVERTDLEECSGCGDCVDVCHFHARRLEGSALAVERERCYGCGLCADVCPADCITLVAREGR